MEIELNGVRVASGENLKETLEREGYFFPCNGKGACGKCKIVAPALETTDRDKRFLTEEELIRGVRLACDKKVRDGVSIETLLEKKEKPRKLSECDILAILGNRTILIGILSDGEQVDCVVLENDAPTPLTGEKKTKAVRSLVAHESIQFFERYGTAKAGTVYVFGTESMLKALAGGVEIFAIEPMNAALFELPAEEVVFAPGGNSIDYIKKLDMPEKTLTERAVRFATDVRFRRKLTD